MRPDVCNCALRDTPRNVNISLIPPGINLDLCCTLSIEYPEMATRQKSDFEKSLIEALKSDNVIKEISNAIINSVTRCFAERFNDYEAKIAALETEIQSLKSNSQKNADDSCDKSRKKMEQKVDNIEQKLKNNNIRLIGIKETDGEDVLTQVKNIFEKRLNIPVSNEIAYAHRVGRKNKEKPRHIVVSFKDNNFKNTVYGKKKLLKGTFIVIKEDLSNGRWKLVQELAEIHGVKNVWTFNGAVFVRSGENVKKLISGV